MEQVYDVAVIGGGINGCGCAADAAIRGLSVVLCEKDDLAAHTSSSSTKLIHGGLRYLEHYEFGLVKKALAERQTLLNLAPHLVHPLPFILPYQQHLRPSWLLRLGLFFYDHLSKKNKLPRCKSIHRSPKNIFFDPLNEHLKRGFLFYDATTDDARLTLANALQAKLHGASIRPNSLVTNIQCVNHIWQLTIQPHNAPAYQLHAKAIINAAGPWVESVAKIANTPMHQEITLVKGSHIIVPALYEGKNAYFLQHDDKRVVFVIPFHGFSMIGTTEVAFKNSLDKVSIDDNEVNYLTSIVNTYFKTQISEQDIVYTWSGIRPLLAANDKDMKSLSRDYQYQFATTPAPYITIYGGKITTFRQLACEVVNQLKAVFPTLPTSQTQTLPLPGASYEEMNFEQYSSYAKEKYSWLESSILNRYLFSYGTRMELILQHCDSIKSMGKKYGDSLYQVEVDYLVKEEWASNCDDILYRRTKLGLTMNTESKKELSDYLKALKIDATNTVSV